MPISRNRQSPRLKGYDYTQQGAYFVTICTYNRGQVFGDVFETEMELNTLGCVAESCWLAIPQHFPNISMDAFVVMPNHIHGIIFIVDDFSVGTRHAVSLPQTTAETFSHPVVGSVSTIVRSYKSAVTNQINRVRKISEPIWQGRFYDHIVRTETSLNRLRQYIVHNPALWEQDKHYSIDK
jgi:putative transposase